MIIFADKQQTLLQPVTLSGIGLHTGSIVTLTIHPSNINSGIVFKRIDLPNQPLIKADVDNVVDTSRCTTLAVGEARVNTVEHLLAGLTASGVDNALIELDGDEIPILDGSALPFLEAIESVGIKEQDAERKYFEIRHNISFRDKDKDAEIMLLPSATYSVKVMIDFKSKILGFQHAYMNELSEFKAQIAPCRTFVFLHELLFLAQNNLVKGGSLDNALVIMEREAIPQEELDQLSAIFGTPDIEVKKGYLSHVQPLFSNEPARHKLLDVVGDLALIGMRLKGQVIATKPGHKTNVEFAKQVKELIKQDKIRRYAVPDVDLNQPSIMSVKEIKRRLPQRFPFLMVDKILKLDQNQIIGTKNVTINEPFFVGHFPEEPIMPGVLIIEAMAQIGGILTMEQIDDPENYLAYFMKIDNVRFKKKVVPGDTLLFKVDLISPFRRGIMHTQGQAFVSGELVAEGEFTAQIIKAK